MFWGQSVTFLHFLEVIKWPSSTYAPWSVCSAELAVLVWGGRHSGADNTLSVSQSPGTWLQRVCVTLRLAPGPIKSPLVVVDNSCKAVNRGIMHQKEVLYKITSLHLNLCSYYHWHHWIGCYIKLKSLVQDWFITNPTISNLFFKNMLCICGLLHLTLLNVFWLLHDLIRVLLKFFTVIDFNILCNVIVLRMSISSYLCVIGYI